MDVDISPGPHQIFTFRRCKLFFEKEAKSKHTVSNNTGFFSLEPFFNVGVLRWKARPISVLKGENFAIKIFGI
jgi:hypothetical protein